MDADFSTLMPMGIALVGAFLAVVAAGWYQFKKSRLQKWSRVEGKVVAYTERQVENGVVFDPIVTFADMYGRETNLRPKEWWNRKRFEIGTSIPVVFNPSNPTRAFIDIWSSCYSEVITFLIFSGFLLLGAGGMAMFVHATK